MTMKKIDDKFKHQKKITIKISMLTSESDTFGVKI